MVGSEGSFASSRLPAPGSVRARHCAEEMGVGVVWLVIVTTEGQAGALLQQGQCHSPPPMRTDPTLGTEDDPGAPDWGLMETLEHHAASWQTGTVPFLPDTGRPAASGTLDGPSCQLPLISFGWQQGSYQGATMPQRPSLHTESQASQAPPLTGKETEAQRGQGTGPKPTDTELETRSPK